MLNPKEKGTALDIYELGERLRQRRALLRMTQEQLSQKLDISKNFLGDVERGKKSMSTKTLYKAAKILNVSIDYLMDGSRSSCEIAPQGMVPDYRNQENKNKFLELLDRLDEYDIAFLIHILIHFIHYLEENSSASSGNS